MPQNVQADLSSGGLPVPPLEMRVLVGPTEESAFDNPSGAPIFAGVPVESYEAVFDFGCRCGRIARQLIQQTPRPERYVGIDLHPHMVDWCNTNLAPRVDGFEFLHHDVHELGFNPGTEKAFWRPFPVESDAFSLLIAYSVFTHTLEDQTLRYLEELRRVLRTDGVAITT